MQEEEARGTGRENSDACGKSGAAAGAGNPAWRISGRAGIIPPVKLLPPLLLLVLAFATAHAADPLAAPAANHRPFVLPRTEVRDLPFKAPGRQYQIQIALPGSYAKETRRRYPVIFVTDGYWDFPLIGCIHGNLNYDKVVPECILVGLGYAGENLNYGVLRERDLTPAPLDRSPGNSGYAAEYLALLEREIIPLVEREYRVDSRHRILAGSSLGGLFTLYAMLTQPELFYGYVAVSPAAGSANDWLFDYEAQFAKTGRALKARLFISGAEYEWPGFLDAIQRFCRRLDSRKYKGLRGSYTLVATERHAGTKAEGYSRGLRFALAPLAPESGPMGVEPPPPVMPVE
jgi:predicted alpha/beta superfamily hydrolase